MTPPEHAAYLRGLATGKKIGYRKGDLFRDDFVYPLNPYLSNETLRAAHDRGLDEGLGEDFRADRDFWLSIEILKIP